jgi:hypothetical protein
MKSAHAHNAIVAELLTSATRSRQQSQRRSTTRTAFLHITTTSAKIGMKSFLSGSHAARLQSNASHPSSVRRDCSINSACTIRGLFTLWAHQKVKGGSDKLKMEVGRLEQLGVLHRVAITACAVWDTVSALQCTPLKRCLARG